MMVNPHTVMDGPWGGWGPSEWYRAERMGFAPGDVLCREGEETKGQRGIKWKWTEVWINKDKQWRCLMQDEFVKLPDPNEMY